MQEVTQLHNCLPCVRPDMTLLVYHACRRALAARTVSSLSMVATAGQGLFTQPILRTAASCRKIRRSRHVPHGVRGVRVAVPVVHLSCVQADQRRPGAVLQCRARVHDRHATHVHRPCTSGDASLHALTGATLMSALTDTLKSALTDTLMSALTATAHVCAHARARWCE